jgi:hypothetical protein
MGAMRAERLDDRRGRLKYLEISDDVTRFIHEHLDDDRAKEFLNDLLKAIAEAKEKDDVTAINDVIEAWYRTVLFLQKEGFGESLDTALDTKRRRRPRSVDDLLKRDDSP